MLVFVDLETYSATPITAGVYRYAEDPEFRILMAAWSVDGGPVHVDVGETAIAHRFYTYGAQGARFVAHNANFDRICLSRILVDGYLPPEEWLDTMALAAEHGYPQSLAHLAVALGGEQKDTAGTRLINLFCKPNRHGMRVLPEDKPEEWEQFKNYCAQDVVTMCDAYARLGYITQTERDLWNVDQRINDRGIKIDVELARAGVDAAEENAMLNEIELSELTGIAKPNSNPQLLAWLNGCGVGMKDLQAETVAEWLTHPHLTARERRVLELRQELALVASKKFTSALASVSSDGRLRGGFRFFGAHTGRWAGRGVQPHNLPRAQLPTETDTEAAILDLKLGLGAEPQTLKALVRALFVGPFVVVDYAAIEARVLAWLANESWALEAFRTGRDIYVETAERMGGLTRFQGKVAVLALGYCGGVNSLRHMGAQGDDTQLQFLVNQWRRANPSIVKLWQTMEDAFAAGDCPVGARVSVEKDGDSRFVRLPSGRAISYHGVGTNNGRLSFRDPRKPGVRVGTYGGRLVENLTQAVARDVLAEALIRLHQEGFKVVGHVHDEIIVEGTDDMETVRKIMVEPPGWADGMPIDGEGFVTERYRKA